MSIRLNAFWQEALMDSWGQCFWDNVVPVIANAFRQQARSVAKTLRCCWRPCSCHRQCLSARSTEYSSAFCNRSTLASVIANAFRQEVPGGLQLRPDPPIDCVPVIANAFRQEAPNRSRFICINYSRSYCHRQCLSARSSGR